MGRVHSSIQRVRPSRPEDPGGAKRSSGLVLNPARVSGSVDGARQSAVIMRPAGSRPAMTARPPHVRTAASDNPPHAATLHTRPAGAADRARLDTTNASSTTAGTDTSGSLESRLSRTRNRSSRRARMAVATTTRATSAASVPERRRKTTTTSASGTWRTSSRWTQVSALYRVASHGARATRGRWRRRAARRHPLS